MNDVTMLVSLNLQYDEAIFRGTGVLFLIFPGGREYLKSLSLCVYYGVVDSCRGVVGWRVILRHSVPRQPLVQILHRAIECVYLYVILIVGKKEEVH